MSYQQQIVISTKGHGDMRNLTEQVTAIVQLVRPGHMGYSSFDYMVGCTIPAC